MVIACQNNALALGNGNPATRLQGLGGFVDEDSFKDQVANVTVAGTHQRAGDNLYRFEHVLDDEALQIVGGLAQRPRFFPQPLAVLTLLETKVAYVFVGSLAVLLSGLAHRMHLAVAGVGHHIGIEGVMEQQVRHAARVTHADHVDTTLGQLFSQQVHGCVRRGTH